MCGRITTYDQRARKGDIHWPATVVGSRTLVRCPYAYDQPFYAHRDCVLVSDLQSSKWNDVNVTRCPYSPFRQAVDRLAGFLASISRLTDRVLRYS